jgi:hypothetical protein
MKKTYQGSCHCGQVRFECNLDLAEGTSRCNCSICSKARFWKAFVPGAALRVLEGEAALQDYRFASHSIRHRFCRHCGIKVFGEGSNPAFGGQFFAVNLACLDDLPADELAAAPLRFEDGRHDDWAHAPADTRLL